MNLTLSSTNRSGWRWPGSRLLRYLTALLCTMPAAWSQPVQTIPKIAPRVMDLYAIEHQDMQWNQHQYRIFIATPRLPANSTSRQPVLYVLDGNAQFPLAVNELLTQWEESKGKRSPTAELPLVVGLGYPEDQAYPLQARTRDYTFAAPGEAFAKGGGASNFYGFLNDSVKPYIQKHYHVDPERQILSGHSFGGLFALYVFLNHPASFTHYIIGSPSLWWGNAALVESSQDSAQNEQASFTRTLLPAHAQVQAVSILQGEYEENPHADPNIAPDRLARIKERKSRVTARQLEAWLRDHGVRSEFTLLPGLGHGGVIPEVIRVAVRTALGVNER